MRAFQCPPWRKPSTAFAALNFAEDAETITGSARALLWALAKRTDWRTGECPLYLDELMARAGLRCPKACAKAVRRLVELGVLHVGEGTRAPRQETPPRRIYRLMLPEGYRVESPVPIGSRARYLSGREPDSYNEEQETLSSEEAECSTPGVCVWGGNGVGEVETCMACGEERERANDG